MRPRIRTIKPEMWADEKVGDLSHGARLLFIGLISMADDEGRLRELPAAIIGHVFPYDSVSTAKLTRWLGEIAGAGMIQRYQVGEKRYIAFPHWTDHQRVDRPNDSELPAPPVFDDSSPNGSPNGRRSTSDRIEDHSRSLRGRASGPIPSGPDPSLSQRETKPEREPSKTVDPNEIPASLPVELRQTASETLRILEVLQAERGGYRPTARGVGLVLIRFPDRDHEAVVRELEYWALAGSGQNRQIRDWTRTLATFLERSPSGSAPRSSANVVQFGRRENASDWLRQINGEAS